MTIATTSSPTTSIALIRRLVKTYMVKRAKPLALAFFLMLISAAMTGMMAQLMEPIVDKVFTEKNKDMLIPVSSLVFLVFAVRGITAYAHNVIMNKVGARIVSDMQAAMFSHLIRADVAYFQKHQSGSFISRFTTDTMMIRSALNETLLGIGKNFFTLCCLIAVMVYQDWKLSLMSIFVFPAAALVVAKLGKKLRKVSTVMQEEVGNMTAALGQALQGNRHIKAYNTEEFENARIDSVIEKVYRLIHKSYKISTIASPISEMLSALAIVAIVLYGGSQVIAGATTAGKLFSFIAAFLMAFEPMKRLAKLNGIMQTGLAAADRYFDLLDMEPAIRDKPGATVLQTRNPEIMIEGVSFSYDGDVPALHEVSFTVPAGKTVTLVGESGAGKSTILNLMPRFYDVTEGRICIDGMDIRDVTLASLRGSMALVSQDVAIFNDTVRDNIAYGQPDVTAEDVMTAARNAAAHDFIMELPQGYDTIVGENGTKLSGGQKQRIAIARAMLRNAPILLLDEATSALDTGSERLVQAALDRLQKGRTTIVVAHRLSTIMNADIIYVMSEGRIVEQGTHETLLAAKGMYASLYGSMTLKESA